MRKETWMEIEWNTDPKEKIQCKTHGEGIPKYNVRLMENTKIAIGRFTGFPRRKNRFFGAAVTCAAIWNTHGTLKNLPRDTLASRALSILQSS